MTYPQTKSCQLTNRGFQEAVRTIDPAGGLQHIAAFTSECVMCFTHSVLRHRVGSKLEKVQRTRTSCSVTTYTMNSRAKYCVPGPLAIHVSKHTTPPTATLSRPQMKDCRGIAVNINTHHIDFRDHINAGNINVHSYSHRGTCKPRWTAT